MCARLARSDEAIGVHVLGSAEGPSAPGLHYEGYQADLSPWVSEADCCLLPYPEEAALCGGARNKLLEYLALGRTLVTTREGLRGLPEAAEWPGVTVAGDDPEAFASAVLAATAADAEPLDLERAAGQLRWESLGLRVRQVLDEVVAAAPGA